MSARIAELDLILERAPYHSAALIERGAWALQMDNPQDLAHAARMLMQVGSEDARRVADHCIVRLLNHADPPRCINIGGGRDYHYAGWWNFDQQRGPLNPWPIKLDAQVGFPVASGWARLVYSSHCLEHLDDDTVGRVLDEARRMLRPDGALLLKLPDFEQVLERWRAGDEAYFDQWGMRDVIPTWASKGVEPTIDAKAAFIFCGWWNDAYGDEFGKRRPDAEGAYHGPPQCEQNAHFRAGSIHGIAESLRICTPSGAHFNHRNAWSRAELTALLERHDFEVLTLDAAQICKRYTDVPQIERQRGISMYALALPV